MRINLVVSVCLIMAARALSQTLPVEEKRLQINGTELFTKSMGKGESIVFLHGGPGMDHTYFLPQMAELAKDYRLIFFDQRTSGRSAADVAEASVTLDNFVEDIEGSKNPRFVLMACVLRLRTLSIAPGQNWVST